MTQNLTKALVADHLSPVWFSALKDSEIISTGDDSVIFLMNTDMDISWESHPSFVLSVLRAVRTVDPSINRVIFSKDKTLSNLQKFGKITNIRKVF